MFGRRPDSAKRHKTPAWKAAARTPPPEKAYKISNTLREGSILRHCISVYMILCDLHVLLGRAMVWAHDACIPMAVARFLI